MSGKNKKTFTLIELLVVIAIISILASILMPALSKVRRQMMQIDCMSHLKQMGLAMQQYADDNTQTLPGRDSSSYAQTWAQQILPYINPSLDYPLLSKIFWCMQTGAFLNKTSLNTQAYSMNAYLNNHYSSYVPVPKLSRISAPSTLILVSDSDTQPSTHSNYPIAYIYSFSSFNFIDGSSPLGCLAGNRHSNKANMVFIDCHAAAVEPGNTDVARIVP